MYELDHMLNGKHTASHHEELIQQAEQEHLTQAAHKASRVPRPLHALFVLLMKIMWSI